MAGCDGGGGGVVVGGGGNVVATVVVVVTVVTVVVGATVMVAEVCLIGAGLGVARSIIEPVTATRASTPMAAHTERSRARC